MLKGIENSLEPQGNNEELLFPSELLLAIFLKLPYAVQVKCRELSKDWKYSLDRYSFYPLLKTITIKMAEAYIEANSSHPEKVGLNKIVTNYATLHPSTQSMDSVLVKYKCKWMNDDPVKGWQPSEPDSEELLPVSRVLLFAARKVFVTQYASLKTREQRHAFIMSYINLPENIHHPRTHCLGEQTPESLKRLKESLSRYTDGSFKALIVEVDSLLSMYSDTAEAQLSEKMASLKF